MANFGIVKLQQFLEERRRARCREVLLLEEEVIAVIELAPQGPAADAQRPQRRVDDQVGKAIGDLTRLPRVEPTRPDTGERMVLEGGGIEANGADVQVVMKLDNPPGDRQTGYNAVLATDTTIVQHSVNVHVPDVPDLANHTVDVKVYVTDAKGTRACDAGRIRVV